MNKHDIVLVIVMFLLVIGIYILLNIFSNNEVNNAFVYYDGDLILTIDLNKNEKKYVVDGYNGEVEILAGNGKIKVNQEDSPLHICSRQGYISKSYESIVCLPNKIVITLGKDDNIDTVIK